jgi:hypothetical protein
MAVFLSELPVADPDRNLVDRAGNLADYLAIPQIARLDWPAEVIEQWLFDHGGNVSFLTDYGALDLSEIRWAQEEVPVEQLRDTITGQTDQEYLVTAARLHEHWVRVRGSRVQEAWRIRGTWLVPPILITRELLLEEPGIGLQVIEGRTRVGVLQGRLAEGLLVAANHQSWVGRRDESSREG